MSGDYILIDGSVLEGGGQILRIAVSCAAIINREVRVNNIRAGRSKPGLSNQHLAGIQLCAQLAQANLSDCRLASKELHFQPKGLKAGTYNADAKTAGSISLLLQVAVPVLAYARSDSIKASVLDLKGGTDAAFAPPIDYMTNITFHYFKRMGLQCTLKVHRRGFYPQGGGHITANIVGLHNPLNGLELLDFGSLERITGQCFVAGRVPVKVAHEMKTECQNACAISFPSTPVHIDVFREDDSRCTGNVSSFLFIAHTSTGCRLAVSGLGDPRGPHHTELVRNSINELTRLVQLKACCDDNMQDQLILPMALAKGVSNVRTGPLTLHTKTAIYVTELMLPVKFKTTQLDDGAFIISCNGSNQEPIMS